MFHSHDVKDLCPKKAWIDLIDTLTNVRYCCKVLFSTDPNFLSTFEVKDELWNFNPQHVKFMLKPLKIHIILYANH